MAPALLAAGLAGWAGTAPASAARYATSTVHVWKTNAYPMGWSASLDRVIYNSRGADGRFDAYSAAPDGSDARCLTCAKPVLPGAGTATHRGAGDVDPKGDLMLVAVERGEHFGAIGADEAQPGKGAYSDVWLERTDGSQAWPLTDIYAPGSDAMGVMWPRFDRTGTRIVWAELYGAAIGNLGAWRLKTAGLAWSGGRPHLANVRHYQPEDGRFMEPYGFSPDNRRIIFASDLGMPSYWDAQIYTVAADFHGPAQRLSPNDPAPFPFADYNEFAFYVPQGDHIIYGRTAGTRTGGMEYWVMNPDGTGQHQLTDLAQQTDGAYAAVGGLAFDPRNPYRFVAGVAADAASEAENAMMFTVTRDGASAVPSPAPGSASTPSRRRPADVRVSVPRQSLRSLLRSRGFVVRVRTAAGGRARVEARTGRTLRGRGASSLAPGRTVRVVARARRRAIRASAGRRVRLRITVQDRARRSIVVTRTLRVRR